jgi:RES domain-containing protein
MRVWRLTRAAHARDTLSGRGAALVGGRWNSPGVRMVYASTHRSLALLEMLVHVQKDTVPADLVFVEIDLPDRLIRSASPLPAGWDALPWSASARDFGDRWAAEHDALAVLVPSIVVPAEDNVLINPLHPQAPRLQAHPPEPFPLDQRLFA